MIFGIGIDVVRLDRMERAYRRFGQRFVDRLLLPREMSAFQTNKRPARFLAMRFAAKEAVVKAMGTGFANGMWIRDTGTVPDRFGRPEVVFSPRGDAKCAELGVGSGHLTLTDEAGLVVAVAVMMRAGAE